jgi:hypothetical protein
MYSSADAAQALAPVLEDIFHALRSGLQVSQQVHAMAGWDSGADRHLASQLVRREAVERLRNTYDTTSEPWENLGLPMSGIILKMPSNHVLRVWHSTDGDLPPAVTAPLRDFYHQRPSALGDLIPLPFADVDHDGASNLAVLWDSQDGEISRYELVRTFGLDGRTALVEWRYPLLAMFQRDDDLEYGDNEVSASRGEIG